MADGGCRGGAGFKVKRTLAAIAAESTWAPSPSPLCEWCPFNSNGCDPKREEEILS